MGSRFFATNIKILKSRLQIGGRTCWSHQIAEDWKPEPFVGTQKFGCDVRA
jgi:hypothetical protein